MSGTGRMVNTRLVLGACIHGQMFCVMIDNE